MNNNNNNIGTDWVSTCSFSSLCLRVHWRGFFLPLWLIATQWYAEEEEKTESQRNEFFIPAICGRDLLMTICCCSLIECNSYLISIYLIECKQLQDTQHKFGFRPGSALTAPLQFIWSIKNNLTNLNTFYWIPLENNTFRFVFCFISFENNSEDFDGFYFSASETKNNAS